MGWGEWGIRVSILCGCQRFSFLQAGSVDHPAYPVRTGGNIFHHHGGIFRPQYSITWYTNDSILIWNLPSGSSDKWKYKNVIMQNKWIKNNRWKTCKPDNLRKIIRTDYVYIIWRWYSRLKSLRSIPDNLTIICRSQGWQCKTSIFIVQHVTFL